MSIQKPVLGTLVALTALALTAATGTARADQLPYNVGASFGSGDVSGSYNASAYLTYCNAAELAAAGTPTDVCQFQLGPQCIFYEVEYPECLVKATESYGKALASAYGSLTVFGVEGDIYVSPSAITKDGASSLNFYASAFGNTLINTSDSSIPIGFSPSFEAKKDFSIVGISVKVDATASAFIGGTLGGGAINDGIEVKITPTITASLDASADVSVACASAGIEGNIDLLDLELPTDLSVAYTGGKLGWGIDTTFTYALLSGDLKVKACACGDCTHKTIASYGGWNGGFTVLNQKGSFSL